jgi:hypothetical protein
MARTLLAVALAAGLWQSVPELVCARFQSPAKLAVGDTFRAPLPNGLEFRLSKDWRISVGPVRSDTDYLWLVSPPLHFAPQLYLRGSYNVPDAQAPTIGRNPLHFVLNRADYDAALASHKWEDAGKTLARLEELGKGTLNIYVDKHELDGDKLRSISFHGEGCVPK